MKKATQLGGFLIVTNIYPSFAAVCTINSIKVVKYQQISAK